MQIFLNLYLIKEASLLLHWNFEVAKCILTGT